MDFSSVKDEVSYWLSHISQGFGKNGETGIDVGLPYHTPVYATSSGKVLGSGFYGGGGVVSTQFNAGTSEYYQHLSDIVVSKGQQVQTGQLIGYSGGQIGYGDHPSSTKFSEGPHLEVGFNAPYGAANQSIWSPLGLNFNPVQLLQQMGLGNAATGAAEGGAAQAGGNALSGAALGGLFQSFGVTPSQFAWRAGLVVGGMVLIVVGILVFFSHESETVVTTGAKVAAKAAVA